MQHNLDQKDSLSIHSSISFYTAFYEWRKVIVVFLIIMMTTGGYICWFVTALKLAEWYIAGRVVMTQQAVRSVTELISISLLIIGILKTTPVNIFLKKADSERLVWWIVILTIILPSSLLVIGKIVQVYVPLLQEVWGYYQPVAAMTLTKHYDALRQTHPFLPNLQLSFF